MSEINALRLNGGMTREGIATGGPSLDAQEAANGGRRALERLTRNPRDPEALAALERNLGKLEDAVREAPGLADRYEELIGRLRDRLQTELPPRVSVSVSGGRPSAGRNQLSALRGQPARAARALLGGRRPAALRRMNVDPSQIDRRLRNAGFDDDQIAAVHDALDAEIGRRFQQMVRTDGLRIVERLEHQLQHAIQGDPRALREMEDQLFSARGPELLQRLMRAGAEVEAHALEGLMMRRDREGARPLLRRALERMYDVVHEQAERVRRGEEGVADSWGGAYRAFETSIQRQARALGVHPDPTTELKDPSVLDRAIHRSIRETNARHEDAVETGRDVFDRIMSLAGLGLLSSARAVVERREATVDAQRRAVAGNGTIATAREAETEEVVQTARAIGTGALGSVVDGMVAEMLADAEVTELVDEEIEQLGDRVYDELRDRFNELRGLEPVDELIPTSAREAVRWLVRKMVMYLKKEATGQLVPDDTLERALDEGER